MPTAAPTDWLSYDSVADIYDRVAVPWFSALAGDLIAAAGPKRGERVLDLGTGTGLAARAALAATPRLTVVAADPSPGMLSKLATDARVAPVSAMAPGLPFPPAVFDLVVANLCLSHLREPAVGVGDVARVLRPGGRFACTAWAAAEDDRPGMPRGDANQILLEVRANMGLDLTPPDSAAPWEDWLRDPAHLPATLSSAGFDRVAISSHRSRWTFSVADYIAGWGSDARYRRSVVGQERWQDYIDTASAALRDRVGDEIEILNVAWIAVGHQPGHED